MRLGALLLLAFVVGGGAVGLRRWLGAPAPVPDHAAPFVATRPMLFAGEGTLSQRLRATRVGLRAVDLIVVAENAGLPGEVEVRLAEWPSERVLRVSRRPAADVPAGYPWRFRPGQPDERWLTFGFEPLSESAGREFLLTVSYPRGRDVPGERLAVLAHLPARYPDGRLGINGDVRSGNLLFRLAGTGTRWEALAQAGDNLARQQPYFPSGLVLPGALAGAGVALGGALALAIAAGRREGAGGEWSA